MEKVILVHPSDETEFTVWPLACLFLASFLLREGFKVLIFDHNEEKDFASFFKKNIEDTICIGISSITGTQIRNGLKIAQLIRKLSPQTPLVWGGRHPTALPGETLEHPLVDIVVRGEGEETFLELVKAISRGSSLDNIPGISYKKNGRIIHNMDRPPLNLDNFPILPWHLLDLEKKLSREYDRSISFQTGRGCPYACTFCSHKKVKRERYRGFSASYILDNIEPLIKRYNIRKVNFFEPFFTTTPRRIKEICEEIIRRELDIEWNASARANTFSKFDEETLRLLRASGCEQLTFGFESGSPRVLKLINKRATVEESIKSVKLCHKYGIVPDACFMTGFPFETLRDTVETLQVISRMIKECPELILHLQGYMPLPATLLYEECVRKYGLKRLSSLEDWGDIEKWKDLRPWLPWWKKVMVKLLRGTIYASSLKYLRKRKDLKFRYVLHTLVRLFYRLIGFLGGLKK